MSFVGTTGRGICIRVFIVKIVIVIYVLLVMYIFMFFFIYMGLLSVLFSFHHCLYFVFLV